MEAVSRGERLLSACNIGRFLIITSLVLVTTGCATTGQRISLDCSFLSAAQTSRYTTTKSVASDFEDAAFCTNKLVRTVQQRLNNHEHTVNMARFATVLGTLGATTAALYNAHRDLIVGAGLLGGSGYVYGNLYAPPPYLAIYTAGLDAAICVDGVARQAAGTISSLSKASSILGVSATKLDDAIELNTNASDEADKTARKASKDAHDALRIAAGVLAQEAHFANGIVNVAQDISGAIDHQLIENTPNLQAFRDAGQQTLAIAQGFVSGANVPTSGTPPPSQKSKGPGGVESSEVRTSDDEQTKNLQAAAMVASENTTVLTTVLKTFSNPDANRCAALARNAGIKPLRISPSKDELSLEVGTTYSITASGGQPSYRGGWAGGEPPDDELRATQSGDNFKFERKKTSKDDYNYVIRDASGAEKPLKIKHN